MSAADIQLSIRFALRNLAEALRQIRIGISYARRQSRRQYRADPTRLRRRHMHHQYRRRER